MHIGDEDARFHADQMMEAGVPQFIAWGYTDKGRHILIAIARYLAARPNARHCRKPTSPGA